MRISGISNHIIMTSKINPTIPALEKNENFINTFPKQNLIPETKIKTVFPFFKDNNQVSNFLSSIFNIQDNFAQYNVSKIRGEARPTNEFKKYLEYPSEKIKELAFQIVDEEDSSDEKMYKIEQWVYNNIPYKYDIKNYRKNEYWATPSETLRKGSGDCIAHYEEIWTKKGLKKVSDLKVGNKVLSYDFDKQKFCYKPITKIWEKGKLSLYRVRFRNGTWFDVTEDHPFWSRQAPKRSIYKKTKLKD